MENLRCVSIGRIKEDIMQRSYLRGFYGGQILFVDKDWYKAERMAYHHF